MDGQLPFLDMILHNNEGRLMSSWYRKPTDTGLTLNFHSLAPLKYTKSVVIRFVHRIYRSCSSWSSFHDGLNEARDILSRNQYPPSFVESIIKTTLYKVLGANENDDENKDENDESIMDVTLDPNACVVQVDNKDKFKFFSQL